MSQELTDAEWLRKCAEDIDVACIDAIDAKESRRDAARLRSIAAKLERPAVESRLWHSLGGWVLNPGNFTSEELTQSLGMPPQVNMPVTVTINPV